MFGLCENLWEFVGVFPYIYRLFSSSLVDRFSGNRLEHVFDWPPDQTSQKLGIPEFTRSQEGRLTSDLEVLRLLRDQGPRDQNLTRSRRSPGSPGSGGLQGLRVQGQGL